MWWRVLENSEQYIIKDDSSGINKVEPRVYSSLWCSGSFCFFRDGGNYLKIIGIKYLNRNNYKKIRIGHNEILVTGKLDGDESLLTDKKKFYWYFKRIRS